MTPINVWPWRTDAAAELDYLAARGELRAATHCDVPTTKTADFASGNDVSDIDMRIILGPSIQLWHRSPWFLTTLAAHGNHSNVAE